MPGYVYILKSLKTGRFYIGSTNDINRRLSEHNSQTNHYTSNTGPYVLVFHQELLTLTNARQVEVKLKKLKNRDLIQQIITKGKLFINSSGKIYW